MTFPSDIGNLNSLLAAQNDPPKISRHYKKSDDWMKIPQTFSAPTNNSGYKLNMTKKMSNNTKTVFFQKLRWSAWPF